MPIPASIAIVAIGAALLIRRATWSSPAERGITINLLLQGAAVVLMLPITNDTLGQWLYERTGYGNLTNLIGHDFYVVAASSILMTALYMRNPDEVLQRKFRQRVEMPCLMIIPVMLALFLAHGEQVQAHDFFAVDDGIWLVWYWLALTGILGYALAYSAYLFWPVIYETRLRTMVVGYILASASGVLACAIKAVSAMFQVSPQTAPAVWAFATACGIGFAVTSAWDWYKHWHLSVRQRVAAASA